jgi:release factor glutamine methyltransferase
MTLKDLMTTIRKEFPEITTGDASLILSDILDIPKLELLLRGNRETTPEETAETLRAFQRRTKGEPIQYITGKAYFRNLALKVGPGVLIPRPETETMVDIAIEVAPPNPKICDLGTGSGAVAIAMATEIKGASVAAVDISPKALEYTRKNIYENNAENIRTIQADLLKPFKKNQFDIITANLPYVSDCLFEQLPREVREFEPETALRAKENGLELIRKTAETAPPILNPNGTVIFEISPEQTNDTLEILKSARFEETEIRKDLAGKNRFAMGKLTRH